MQYMVSYTAWDNLCGNKVGTLEEVNEYANDNREKWKSFMFFQYVEGGVVSNLVEITSKGEVVKKK